MMNIIRCKFHVSFSILFTPSEGRPCVLLSPLSTLLRTTENGKRVRAERGNVGNESESWVRVEWVPLGCCQMVSEWCLLIHCKRCNVCAHIYTDGQITLAWGGASGRGFLFHSKTYESGRERNRERERERGGGWLIKNLHLETALTR